MVDLVPEIVPDETSPSAFEAAAARTKRSVVHQDSLNPVNPKKMSQVADQATWDALPAGSAFLDPEGNQRYKPIQSAADYDAIAEGAEFADPEGNIRTKPIYQGVGFTAEMLHDMAVTPQARRQALEMFYPGKVQPAGEGFEIVDEGPDGQPVYRKPGRVGKEWGAFGGKMAAETAPMLGMTGGVALGGAAGAAAGTATAPGPGTLAGGAAGATAGGVGGAMLGRQFNNIILSLAGIHQDLPAQIGSMGWEGLGAAGGEVVGKAVAAVPGVIGATRKTASGVAEGMRTKMGGLKENLSDVLESLGITPERARNFLGTTPETAQRGADIATRAREMGIKESVVPPSVFAPEAPGLSKLEEFDAAFRRQNVFGQGAQQYYEKSGAELLGRPEIGVAVDTPLTAAEHKVSSYRAGRAALDRTRLEMAQEDAALENARRDAQAATASRRPETEADFKGKMDALVQAHHKDKEAANNFVQSSLRELQHYADDVLKISNPTKILATLGEKSEMRSRLTTPLFGCDPRNFMMPHTRLEAIINMIPSHWLTMRASSCNASPRQCGASIQKTSLALQARRHRGKR